MDGLRGFVSIRRFGAHAVASLLGVATVLAPVITVPARVVAAPPPAQQLDSASNPFTIASSTDRAYLAYGFIADGSPQSKSTIRVLRASDGAVTTLTTAADTPNLAIAGTGATARVVFVSDNRVHSVSVSGGAAVMLSPILPVGTSIIRFSVSANGASVAYSTASGGFFGAHSLYAVPVAGPAPSGPLGALAGALAPFVFSPNGSHVAFLANQAVTGADLLIAPVGGVPTFIDSQVVGLGAAESSTRFVYQRVANLVGPVYETRSGVFGTAGAGTLIAGVTAFGTLKFPAAGSDVFLVEEAAGSFRIASSTNAFTPWLLAAEQIWIANGSVIATRRLLPAAVGSALVVVGKYPLSGGGETVLAGASELVAGVEDVGPNGDLIVWTNVPRSVKFISIAGGPSRTLSDQSAGCVSAGFSSDGQWMFATRSGSPTTTISTFAASNVASPIELAPVLGCQSFADVLGDGLFVYLDSYFNAGGQARNDLRMVRRSAAPPPSAIESLSPRRLLDTRPRASTFDGLFAGGGVRAAGSTLELTIAGRGGIPATAASAVLNITAADAQGSGFVTAYPCGESLPNASNLNYIAGTPVPNLVSVKIGANGKVCLFVSAATHLIVDSNGFVPSSSSFGSISPARLLDSRAPNLTIDGQFSGMGRRAAGSITPVTVVGRAGVPASATSVMLNVTVADASDGGYITVFPCGETTPNASSVNFVRGGTTPNTVLAKVGSGGQVCVFTSAGIQLIVDANGFTPSGSTLAPVTPGRLLDSRGPGLTVDGLQSGGGKVAAGSTTAIKVRGRGGVPATAASALLNITVDAAVGGGYLTVYPCGEPLPDASNLNFVAGQTVANAVLAKIGSNGEVCVYSYAGVQLIVDVNGYVDV